MKLIKNQQVKRASLILVRHFIPLTIISYKKIEATASQVRFKKLLENYLQNRFQYISFNDKSSSEKTIECDIPQGSVLGPILFLFT